ncbi:zinc finger protein 583-like [Epinephelus moara]|uniref:zinc finger protein 583-like n=1 Tax=Epinephelus moara TaxID=300413 RepID=UPI00214EBA5F|nr:zinc finger protein 583-like [Epinephelus moara]
MTKAQMLRAVVQQRLIAAAEEIFGLFERTIAEYEEELCRSQMESMRQRKLLDAVYNPQLRLHREDIQVLLVGKEEVPSEQQEWSSSLDQEAPHVKEEQEELWINQEGEWLQGLEEADVTRFPFISVPVESEDVEENPHYSQLHQRQIEQMATEADGEDYGGPDAANDSNPDRYLQSDTDDDSSSQASESDTKSKNCKKPLSCPECEKTFRLKAHLVSHMRAHTGEKKTWSCSVCKKSFPGRAHLDRHMRVHTVEKSYTCSVCEESFRGTASLVRHMKIHVGEKLFSCSICTKKFSVNAKLQKHMRIHSGIKPFGCSYCPKTFARSLSLIEHVRNHTEKPFTCPVCKMSFTVSKTHLKIHTKEKPFSCPACEKIVTVVGNLYEHMRIQTEENASRQDKAGDSPEPETEDIDDECAGRLSSQIHGTQAEKNSEVEPPVNSSAEETETCTEEEYHEEFVPDRNSKPDKHPESDSDFKPEDCSEPETDDSEDYWRETRNSRTGLNPSKNDKVPVSDTDEKPFICCECGKSYITLGNLTRHMNIHKGEKRFICNYCDQRFSRLLDLRRHRCVNPPARRHQTETGEKQMEIKIMEIKTERRDWVGPEPVRTLDTDRHPEPITTNDKLGDSCDPETHKSEDGDDGDQKETSKAQSDLNSLEKSP